LLRGIWVTQDLNQHRRGELSNSDSRYDQTIMKSSQWLLEAYLKRPVQTFILVASRYWG